MTRSIGNRRAADWCKHDLCPALRLSIIVPIVASEYWVLSSSGQPSESSEECTIIPPSPTGLLVVGVLSSARLPSEAYFNTMDNRAHEIAVYDDSRCEIIFGWGLIPHCLRNRILSGLMFSYKSELQTHPLIKPCHFSTMVYKS